MKIVLAEKVSPSTLAVLKEEPGWQIVTADKITDLPAELADADALVVRSAVQVDEALLEHAHRSCASLGAPAWASTTSTPLPRRAMASS